MIPPVPAPAAPAPPPGVHGGGARPAGDPAGEHVGGERRAAERAVGHAHAGDAGHVRPVRAPPASNPRPTRPGPPPAPLRRSGGDGRPAAAHAPDSRFPHDARHPAAADPGRIPAQRRQPGARLVPFAMVPSSPIELEEKRNKNQFISHLMMSIVRLTFFLRA